MNGILYPDPCNPFVRRRIQHTNATHDGSPEGNHVKATFVTGSLTTLLATSLACSDATSPSPAPVPVPSPVEGVYVMHLAGGAAPPALVQQINDTTSGTVMDVHVMADTLIIEPSNRYVQLATIEVRVGPTAINRSRWADRGVIQRTGGALHFESDHIQHVQFDGTIAADGTLALSQNLMGEEGILVDYRFHREQ